MELNQMWKEILEQKKAREEKEMQIPLQIPLPEPPDIGEVAKHQPPPQNFDVNFEVDLTLNSL